MFPKEEFAAFLMTLLKFAKANAFSALACCDLLGVSHQTMARWLAEARRVERGSAVGFTAYTFMVEPVVDKLNRLSELDESCGLFAAIAREKTEKKLEVLRGALDGRAL